MFCLAQDEEVEPDENEVSPTLVDEASPIVSRYIWFLKLESSCDSTADLGSPKFHLFFYCMLCLCKEPAADVLEYESIEEEPIAAIVSRYIYIFFLVVLERLLALET